MGYIALAISGLIVGGAIIALIVALIRHINYLKRLRRYQRGKCVNCGYPMTGANKTQCPECARSTQWEHKQGVQPGSGDFPREKPPRDGE